MNLKSIKSLAVLALLALATGLPSLAAAQQGAPFRPLGENLVIYPPSGWQLAFMDGSPTGDYVVEFLPAGESHNNWREGYMAVIRRSMPPSAAQENIRAHNSTVSQMAMQQVMQSAQRACPGNFQSMRQKDSVTNGVPTSVSGGFCDRSDFAPYGEGSLIAVFQGRQQTFVVQFSWRPATANELKETALRISQGRLQQYLELLNGASLCGAPGEPQCPR